MTSFEALPKTDLGQAVVDRVRDAILEGDLAPGDQLPSERELALQFGVNRTTIREALTRLEILGLIDRRHGRACQVLDFRRRGSTGLVPYLARLRVEGVAESLVEAIEVVYVGVVERAAERAQPEDLAAIERAVNQLETALAAEDEEGIVAADRQVHQCIAAASHSVVLELMVANHYRAFDEVLDARGRVRQAQAEMLIERYRAGKPTPHRRLFQAIAHGDGAQAGAIASALVTHSPRGRRPKVPPQ